MNAQEVWDGFCWPTSQATLGSNAKVCHDALRCLNASLRSRNPIGEMHQSQVEFRLGVQLQIPQRSKIGIIRAIARNWQVNPIDCPLDARRDGIGSLNQCTSILRFLKMLVPGIAIVVRKTSSASLRGSLQLQRILISDIPS